MPAKSLAQLHKLFVLEKEGELPRGTAKKWADETPNIKALPEHVSDIESMAEINGRLITSIKDGSYLK